jgi:hypothetical protein
VAPNVGVNVIGSTTDAHIGNSATVNALNDIVVEATATEDVVLIGIAAGAGGVGVGANVGVLVINDTTKAWIGDSANVYAHGDVFVSAQDDSHVLLISGALGVGGAAGIGAAVGVLDFTKDTEAFIDTNAHVDALGFSGGHLALTGGISGDAFDKTPTHGVIVQAQSSEDILHIVAAGGGGFVGVSGAVGVTLIETKTIATINSGAKINTLHQGDAASNQNVQRSAADPVTMLGMHSFVEFRAPSTSVRSAPASTRNRNRVRQEGMSIASRHATDCAAVPSVLGLAAVWSVTAIGKHQ